MLWKGGGGDKQRGGNKRDRGWDENSKVGGGEGVGGCARRRGEVSDWPQVSPSDLYLL